MTTALHVPTIRDLFNPGSLHAAVTDGYVRRQVHPTEPLAILNYTEKAAYEGMWDDVTRTCRGLIFRTDTLEVVARPFAKFFNHGQAGGAAIALDSPVHVTDKLDGSLGILYPLPSGGWAVATRGSFTSEQADHATKLLAARYPTYEPQAGVTVLFEILYPENRIVVDYGRTDDLHLLGAVQIATGTVLDMTWVANWPGPVTSVFAADTYADALALPPRPNAEGVVVRCLRTGDMVKIKQADYVALHRIVTGLTARTVWEHMAAGKPIAELIEPLPDEFRPWVEQTAAAIQAEVDTAFAAGHARLNEVVASLPDGWVRRDFALAAQAQPDAWVLFNLLDGKDPRPKLLINAKPAPYLTPSGRTYGEDTA